MLEGIKQIDTSDESCLLILKLLGMIIRRTRPRGFLLIERIDAPLGERLCEMFFMIASRYCDVDTVIIHVRSFVEEARAIGRLHHMIDQYTGKYLAVMMDTMTNPVVKKEVFDMMANFVSDDSRKKIRGRMY